MNLLLELRARQIPINWATVDLGLTGPGTAPPQIDIADVRAWLDEALRDDTAPADATDVLVAIDDDHDPRALARRLALESCADTDTELRKWQLVMLRRCLNELPDDPFYAALALADFWAQFGVHESPPAPSSDTFQRHLEPKDREALLSAHEAWLRVNSAYLVKP